MAEKEKKESWGGGGGFAAAVKDMFDGGGRGRSGDTFQGGGIISDIGNASNITPRGSQQSSGGGRGSTQRAAPSRRISNRGILDFFDGGGLGQRGSSFQGLPVSSLLNTMGVRPQGSEVANPRQQAGLSDFYDGGGFGQSGQDFQGMGAYSMLANALGIKPLSSEQPQPAPQAPRAPQAGEGFGTEYSDMLMSDMGLGQNPYGITPEYAQPVPYEGQQIVPTTAQASVPEDITYALNSGLLPAEYAMDREDYLRYMNTGMYPQSNMSGY